MTPLPLISGSPWMMYEPQLADLLRSLGTPRADCDGYDGEQSAAPLYDTVSHVAVIRINGVLLHRAPWWAVYWGIPCCNYLDLSRAVRAALADGNVRGIVLDVDSPGGIALGCGDLAEELFGLRGKKPMIAVANCLATSAALYLATAADQVYVTRSALLGSLGVLRIRADYTKANDMLGIATHFIRSGAAKTDGYPELTYSDEEANRLQQNVDTLFEQFLADVARFRGLDVEALRAAAGDARVFVGAEAIAAGLADRIGTLSDAITALSRDPDPVLPGGSQNDESESDPEPCPTGRSRWGRRIETRAG